MILCIYGKVEGCCTRFLESSMCISGIVTSAVGMGYIDVGDFDVGIGLFRWRSPLVTGISLNFRP